MFRNNLKNFGMYLMMFTFLNYCSLETSRKEEAIENLNKLHKIATTSNIEMKLNENDSQKIYGFTVPFSDFTSYKIILTDNFPFQNKFGHEDVLDIGRVTLNNDKENDSGIMYAKLQDTQTLIYTISGLDDLTTEEFRVLRNVTNSAEKLVEDTKIKNYDILDFKAVNDTSGFKPLYEKKYGLTDEQMYELVASQEEPTYFPNIESIRIRKIYHEPGREVFISFYDFKPFDFCTDKQIGFEDALQLAVVSNGEGWVYYDKYINYGSKDDVACYIEDNVAKKEFNFNESNASEFHRFAHKTKEIIQDVYRNK